MAVSGFARVLGRAPATAWGAAMCPTFGISAPHWEKSCLGPHIKYISTGSSLLCHSVRKTSSSQGGKSEPTKQSLKKPKLPEGRFDAPEDTCLEKEPLTKFPDDVNPVTKEKGGPRGPEPTRYGDWERKGRCIDF